MVETPVKIFEALLETTHEPRSHTYHMHPFSCRTPAQTHRGTSTTLTINVYSAYTSYRQLFCAVPASMLPFGQRWQSSVGYLEVGNLRFLRRECRDAASLPRIQTLRLNLQFVKCFSPYCSSVQDTTEVMIAGSTAEGDRSQFSIWAVSLLPRGSMYPIIRYLGYG